MYYIRKWGEKMSIMFIILLILILYKMKINIKDGFDDYSGKEQSAIIKGIFIFIVFLSHLRQYATFDEKLLDKPGVFIISFLGQLMVAMFLFYSGFGIYESIKKKGYTYIKNMPKNRILKTFFEFAIAVITFIVCNALLGIKHDVKNTILAFTGWVGIGNSNWYMFAIFCLYIVTFIVFAIFKNKKYFPLILNTILIIIYIILLGFVKESYWVNTVLCYAAGMWYSFYLEKINKFFKEHKVGYYILFVLLGIAFIGTRVLIKVNYSNLLYNLHAIVFCLLIVLFTMKIKITNKILLWFGNNLFWIYILQRLPMIVLGRIGLNRYILLVSSLIITIALTSIYSKFVPKLENIIFNSKNKEKHKKSI